MATQKLQRSERPPRSAATQRWLLRGDSEEVVVKASRASAEQTLKGSNGTFPGSQNLAIGRIRAGRAAWNACQAGRLWSAGLEWRSAAAARMGVGDICGTKATGKAASERRPCGAGP